MAKVRFREGKNGREVLDFNVFLSPLDVWTAAVYEASPSVSVVIEGAQGVFQSTWLANTADAVSAVLMHDSVLNEHVLNSTTQSETDWIIAFPTKQYYIDVGSGSSPKLFHRNFSGTAVSCDDVSLTIYDREGQKISLDPVDCGVDLGPNPPLHIHQICSEANVVTFNSSNVLGSATAHHCSTLRFRTAGLAWAISRVEEATSARHDDDAEASLRG